MAAVHSKDTGTELLVRRFLWAKGLRYRVEDVGKPVVYEPPENGSVITEPPYTKKDAERWIAEYEEAVSAVSIWRDGMAGTNLSYT